MADHASVLFPALRGKTWADVSLDAFARRDFKTGPNPLLNAEFCAQWVDALAKEHKTDFTFGGYLEDRAHLWRGHYLAKGPQIHLGVDYNVPAGTAVAALVSGTVVHIGRDGSFGGWGGLVVLKLDTPPVNGADYLYYGHLRWDDTVRLYQKVSRGDIIGYVGEAHENGQWFPHLHLQCVSAGVFAAAAHPEKIDGYAQPPVQAALFPDPHLLAGL